MTCEKAQSTGTLPKWRVWLRAGALATCLGLAVGAAQADIWGYVDAGGLPHFAPTRLDDRYELFLRDNDKVEPHQVTPYFKPEESAAESPKADNPAEVFNTPPPKIVTFFEVSPDYKAVKHLLREASTRHGIDYALLQAVIATESGFNSKAVSPKGAVGLMQVIPPTAARYGVTNGRDSPIAKKLTDPSINIRAGSSYLSDLIKMFPGQIELALAAYNAGEGAVQRAGNKIPNYPETKNYVKTVMQLYGYLKPAGTGPLSGTGTVTTSSSGRVRLEMSGGATGRSNMPPGATQRAGNNPGRSRD